MQGFKELSYHNVSTLMVIAKKLISGIKYASPIRKYFNDNGEEHCRPISGQRSRTDGFL